MSRRFTPSCPKGGRHMSEINDAVQVIKVAFEGSELIYKVSGKALEEIKKLTKILLTVMQKEQMLGKTPMKKLLQKGGDLHVFQFENKDLNKVSRLAKKYGILYSLLPDINKRDNMSELAFHSESAERVNALIAKLNKGKVLTLDDYIKNSDQEEIDKVAGKFDEELKKSDKKETVIDKETVLDNRNIKKEEQRPILNGSNRFNREKLEQLRASERLKIINHFKDASLIDVTIAGKLIVRETDKSFLVRIPYEADKYFWMKKDNLSLINQGKTLLGFLQKDGDYKIYSKDGNLLESVKGQELYDKNFDEVGEAVKEKIEKIERTKEAHKNNKSQPDRRQAKSSQSEHEHQAVPESRRR